MKQIQLMKLAMIAVMAWTCVSARAAMQVATETVNYGSASGPVQSGGTVGKTFQQFDSSLGTLTGITVSLTTSDAALAAVYSLNGGPVSYTDAQVQYGSEIVIASFVGTGETLSVTGSSLASGPFNGTANPGYNQIGSGPVQNFSGTLQVLASDFSSFIGTGMGSVSISVNPGTGLYSGNGQGYGSGNGLTSGLFFGGAFDSYGTMQIDYAYIPNLAVVPEAPGFPLVTAGLAGLVGVGALVRQIRRPAV
jgi:hypothetical protein